MFPSDSTVLQAPTVFLCLPHLFSKWLHNFAGPTVFILFIAVSVFIGFCLLPPNGLVGFCLKPTLQHFTAPYNI